jgi:uncharacterized protein (DUF1697 family)
MRLSGNKEAGYSLFVSRPAKSSRSSPGALTVHVALLRGINVGGNHMIPMADLARMFSKTGCEGVRTYIQSGNVLFAAAPECAEKVPQLVSERIQKRYGFAAPIVLRTTEEFKRIAARNPLLTPRSAVAASPDPDHKLLHVGLLAAEPDPRRVKALDPKRSPQDRFVVRGREVYVLYAGGVAGTKLTNAYFDSTLGTTCTFRNWRTVQKLAELAQGMS